MNQDRVRKVDSIEAMREAFANRVASSIRLCGSVAVELSSRVKRTGGYHVGNSHSRLK